MRGGSRVPLALHQTDLERAMPRGPDGEVVRMADPRQGGWFDVANDGRAEADPARAINCLDCVLSFFETWVHGRPRVSAPRTFDAYAAGDPHRALDGETDGPGRVEDVTGGRFQQLCEPVEDLPPDEAQQAITDAYATLERHLLAAGHGAMAFVINDWEGMGSHAWAVVNQGGTILYLDPQNGEISEGVPLYGHFGAAYHGNVVALDVLVLDARAQPLPLAGLPVGGYSARPPLPEVAFDVTAEDGVADAPARGSAGSLSAAPSAARRDGEAAWVP